VNETRNVLKICDLGTAIDKTDAATAHMDLTPYLVSRFYRAPEIILGIPYDYAVDMWSIGCTLYEMYTGKILFAGDSNNQMLKAIMEIRGKFTPKLFKRGQLSPAHFDDKGQFVSIERDKVLGKVCYDSIHTHHVALFIVCFVMPNSLHLPPSAVWSCFGGHPRDSHTIFAMMAGCCSIMGLCSVSA
jgi:serine/threonine-protein kinase PRP4